MSREDKLPPPDEHDAWEDLGPFYILEEADLLRTLSSFVRPLPPEEIERRSQVYRAVGVLTPEIIAGLFNNRDL